MIFNAEEINKVLYKCLSFRDLTHDEAKAIQTLIFYLDKKEPKITYEEFLELFKVEKKPIDIETVELVVIPKYKFYAKVRDNRLYNEFMDVSSEIEEHLQTIAYDEFRKVLDNLKEKK